MTTGMFMLRALQAGLSVSDLDLLSIGMVIDIAIESGNDNYEYPYVATQADFDRF